MSCFKNSHTLSPPPEIGCPIQAFFWLEWEPAKELRRCVRVMVLCRSLLSDHGVSVLLVMNRSRLLSLRRRPVEVVGINFLLRVRQLPGKRNRRHH